MAQKVRFSYRFEGLKLCQLGVELRWRQWRRAGAVNIGIERVHVRTRHEHLHAQCTWASCEELYASATQV